MAYTYKAKYTFNVQSRPRNWNITYRIFLIFLTLFNWKSKWNHILLLYNQLSGEERKTSKSSLSS